MQPSWQDIIELKQLEKIYRIEYWSNEALFSSGWWVLLIVAIVFPIVWVVILDKKRILEIVTYGLIIATIGILGDIIGLSLLLWEYPTSLFHIQPIISIHTLLMPIIYMTVYQYFKTWKTFLIVAALSALTFTFILEPLLVWLQIYDMYRWKHIYSLVPYFAISIVSKWVLIKFKQWDQHYK